MQKFEEADVSLPQGYELKDRDSNSTLAPQNECNQGCQENFRRGMTIRCDCRLQMFSDFKLKEHLSQKLIEKTISWIQVVGFLKGHQFQTVLLSMSLFYAGLYKLNPNKSEIQSLICSSIFLSGKMTSNVKYTLADILSLVNHRPIPQNILKHEQKILQIFDFNLHIEFPIISLINRETITELQKQKLQFLTELFLIKDPSPLYNVELIQELSNFSCEQKLSKIKNKDKQVYKTMQKLLKKLNYDHLLNKYNSKFNVGSFIQNDNVQRV